MILTIPLRLGRGGNDRKHWRAADRQKKAEKEAVGWALPAHKPVPIPCVVTITRVAPSNGLDDDNLSASCKYVRDTVAKWLTIDDGDARVRYAYAQRRGPWAVEIEIAAT